MLCPNAALGSQVRPTSQAPAGTRPKKPHRIPAHTLRDVLCGGSHYTWRQDLDLELYSVQELHSSATGRGGGSRQTCVSAQVVSFADSLQDNDGRPLVRSARIASSLPLPLEVPDIVVATPAGLMGATTDLGPYAGWEWTKAGIVSRCSPGHCAAAWLVAQIAHEGQFDGRLMTGPMPAAQLQCSAKVSSPAGCGMWCWTKRICC